MRLSAKFVKVLVVLSAFVVGVVAVTTPTPAPASATGVSCSVYVANETGNTVSVIDAATNTVTATIAVGAEPNGVAVSPSGSVYVANAAGNSVSVIDGATGTVVSTILVKGAPNSVAASPSGSVYVTNSSDDTVAVIDSSTNTVTATIAVPSGAGDVAVSPSGTVYVTNLMSKVSVIDPASTTVTDTIDVGTVSSGLAVSASGTVYVTDLGNGRVSVIDGSTNRVTATIGVGTSPNSVAVSPSGTVYVTNGAADTVSVINGSTNTVTATIPVGVTPAGVAAFCPTAAPGEVRMSPSQGSTSTTTFRLELEESAACPAGADAWHTFLVDGSASLRTLQFGETGPLLWDSRDAGKFAKPLFDPRGVQLAEYDGFADFPDRPFFVSFAWNGPIPDGTYQLGLACTKGLAGTGQVLSLWSTPVTISGMGAYWNVGTLAEPRFTG